MKRVAAVFRILALLASFGVAACAYLPGELGLQSVAEDRNA